VRGHVPDAGIAAIGVEPLDLGGLSCGDADSAS
jgi:hypothetical protein